MANDVTGFQVQAYDRRVQMLLERMLVGMKIASTELRGELVKSTSVKRPRHGDFYVDDYIKYTDVEMQDVDTSQETLTIDQSKMVAFRMDEVDARQSDFNVVAKFSQRSAYRLRNEIDAKLLDEIVNAQYTYDDSDLNNGASGDPIALSKTNVLDTFSDAFAKLRGGDVDERLFAVVDFTHAARIEQAAVANGFNIADNTFKNGYSGSFVGGDIFVSNNLRASASLGIATNPTADDTFSIAGVTWTFKATPSAAGEIDIAGSAALTVDNIVAAINNANGYAAGAGSATAYFEVSAANRKILKNKRVVAADGTTTVDITCSGRTTLAETLTAAADVWGDQTVNSMVGVKGAIDMVMQKNVSTSVRQEPKQLVDNYLTHTLYGIKTYTEGAEKLLNLKLKV